MTPATLIQEVAVSRAVKREARLAKLPNGLAESFKACWLTSLPKLHVGLFIPPVNISRKARQRLIQRLPKILGAAYQAANASGYYGPISLHRNIFSLLGTEV